MTEEYWRRWKKQYDSEVYQVNELWRNVQQELKRRYPGDKHYLELDNICRADNPFIRQIKHSPNITADTVAELICRDIGCDLQFCMLLKNEPVASKEYVREISDCGREFSLFSECLANEKQRLLSREDLLREMVEKNAPAAPVASEARRAAPVHAAPPF